MYNWVIDSDKAKLRKPQINFVLQNVLCRQSPLISVQWYINDISVCGVCCDISMHCALYIDSVVCSGAEIETTLLVVVIAWRNNLGVRALILAHCTVQRQNHSTPSSIKINCSLLHGTTHCTPHGSASNCTTSHVDTCCNRLYRIEIIPLHATFTPLNIALYFTAMHYYTAQLEVSLV